MKNYIVNQGLLDRIKYGDEKAIESVDGYLESLYPSQYFNVLCAAATGRNMASVEQADKLARRTAGIMWVRGLVPDFLDALTHMLKNPEKCSVQELEAYSAATAILIEEKIVRNGTLIEIAEAVADGIARMRELKAYDKIDALHELKESISDRLPGSEGGDIPKIYTFVFELARSPSSPNCLNKGILSNMLKRLNEGDSNLARAMGNHMETIKRRIEKTLAIRPKPLSDGDLNLPKPPMARAARSSTLAVISNIGKRLNSNQRGN